MPDMAPTNLIFDRRTNIKDIYNAYLTAQKARYQDVRGAAAFRLAYQIVVNMTSSLE